MNIEVLKNRIKNSRLVRDSFWAVFGNGIGNALMLISGIVIARFLGKDLYGDYGLVKSTMFYVASFATFGLGLTSTKYISQCVSTSDKCARGIVKDSISITLLFSGFIALLLIFFAKPISLYVGDEKLIQPFRYLSIIIMCRALTTTQIGLLAGFKKFEKIARNSVYSGLFLFCLCIPFTYFFSLDGALMSLLLSQIFNSIINHITIKKLLNTLPSEMYYSRKKELIKFSFPIALQESSYTICNWAAIIFLTKFSSSGELGLYTAAAQWNAIITMIPGLLGNVILSYLASSVLTDFNHSKTLKKMISINFITTFIPFSIIFFLADIIASSYGKTFCELPNVLRVLAFSTIFETCSSVFKSEFLAINKTWTLFVIRFLRDILLLGGVYHILQETNGADGAITFSWVTVIVSIMFFITLLITYIFCTRYKKC